MIRDILEELGALGALGMFIFSLLFICWIITGGV